MSDRVVNGLGLVVLVLIFIITGLMIVGFLPDHGVSGWVCSALLVLMTGAYLLFSKRHFGDRS